MSVEDVESDEAREEALEEAVEQISREERRGSLALWFGVLGSPLAWGGHLVAGYSLEEWFACSPSAHTEGEILGIGVKTVSVALNSAMLAVAVLSGLAAFGCWRKLRGARGEGEGEGGEGEGEGDERTDRARWMAFAGTVEAVLFVSIILLGYLPAITIDVCRTTP